MKNQSLLYTLTSALMLMNAAPAAADILADSKAAYQKGDYTQAIQLLQKASNQGYMPAQQALQKLQ